MFFTLFQLVIYLGPKSRSQLLLLPPWQHFCPLEPPKCPPRIPSEPVPVASSCSVHAAPTHAAWQRQPLVHFCIFIFIFTQICQQVRTPGQLLLNSTLVSWQSCSEVCIFWCKRPLQLLAMGASPCLMSSPALPSTRVGSESAGRLEKALAMSFGPSEVTAYFLSLFHHKELAIYASALCVFN